MLTTFVTKIIRVTHSMRLALILANWGGRRLVHMVVRIHKSPLEHVLGRSLAELFTRSTSNKFRL
jgi:hypothetical protein